MTVQLLWLEGQYDQTHALLKERNEILLNHREEFKHFSLECESLSKPFKFDKQFLIETYIVHFFYLIIKKFFCFKCRNLLNDIWHVHEPLLKFVGPLSNTEQTSQSSESRHFLGGPTHPQQHRLRLSIPNCMSQWVQKNLIAKGPKG